MNCDADRLLHCCLFFTANSLARIITRMGEEEFQRLGLSPSGAFLLLLALENPGCTQKDLAGQLNLAQSTVSRLVDSMVAAGLVTRTGEGRNTLVSPTPAARELHPGIMQAWAALRERYNAVLGQQQGDELARLAGEACMKLEGQDPGA